MPSRAELDVEDLLKIVLVLVVIWLVVGIVSDVVETLLGPFQHILGLVVVVLIVLWLLDRI